MAEAGSEPPEYAEVALSVYELHGTSGLNAMTRAAGLGGAYHVGVEVYWLEWSFGWCEEGSGVYMVHPGQSGLGTFRERVPLGRTRCKPKDVIRILDDFRRTWDGPSYDLLRQNCAHFSVAFVKRLKVREAPEWVNSLAAVGDALVSGFGSEEAAEEAARAATPAAELRAPPPMAMIDDEDELEDMKDAGCDMAMRELAWRRATDFVLERAAALERSERFVDLTTDFRWGWGRALETLSAAQVSATKDDLIRSPAHSMNFKEALIRAAFLGLGRKPPAGRSSRSDDSEEEDESDDEDHKEERITVLWIRAQPGNVVRLRFRLHSGSDEEATWPPKLPETQDFAHAFQAELERAIRFGRQEWPLGSKALALALVSGLEVIAAPGKAAFGERVELPNGASGAIIHAPKAIQSKPAPPAAALGRLQRLAAAGGRQAPRPMVMPSLLRAS